MTTEQNESSSFRDRLAAIPRAEQKPIHQLWDDATPPVVRPPAPVARPAIDTPDEAAERFFTEAEQAPSLRQQQPAEVPTKRRRRRRLGPLLAFFILAMLALGIVIPLFIANRTFNNIDRVPLAETLADPLPAGTNMLLVGTDSREGIDSTTDNSGAILGGGTSGSRTDTIMILRIGEDTSSFLSLPRDLWLPIDQGASGRINAAFAQGPDALINTVQNELGIPISHYVQVDLAGFIDVVDAVGGVEITIPHPAFDRNSGLDLPQAGVVELDSAQALAYVRSRFYTEIIDGQEVTDATSDLGRVERQQVFMRALIATLAAERNPATLNSMTSAIGEALIIDDATSFTEVLGLLNNMRGSEPVSVTLPTSPSTVGAASVLVLNEQSSAVLEQFAD